MSKNYTSYYHTDDYYKDAVSWVEHQYDKYGNRIVFANISSNKGGFMASVIFKDHSKPEPKTEQVKIQL